MKKDLSLRIKLIALIAFFSTFNSCSNKKIDATSVVSQAFSKEQLIAFFDQNNISSSYVDTAIKKGLFFPTDTNCSQEYTVANKLDLEWIDLEFKKDINKVDKLINITEVFYQLFADPQIPKERNYDLNQYSSHEIISNLKTGKWAPQCGGIAMISAKIINDIYGDQYKATPVHLDIVEHDGCIIYFKQGEKTHGLYIDPQIGKIGPINPLNGESYSIDSLSMIVSFSKDFIIDLNDSIMQLKRNLQDNIQPCNFLPSGNNKYYFAKKESGFRYERLSYSFHDYIWFRSGKIKKEAFFEDIKSKIIENSPTDLTF